MPTKTMLKIFSIENNQTDQAALEDFVGSEGLPYDLTTAATAAEARQMLTETHFDLILSSDQVVDTPVFDLVGEVEDTALILLTEDDSSQTTASAIKSGAADCLVKDPDHAYLKNLAAAVESAVEENRKKKETRQYYQKLEQTVAQKSQLLIEANQRLADEAAQRSRALDELKDSKEIHRRFFQTAHDAVFITRADGNWIDMNKSAISLFGFAEEDSVLDINLFDLFQDPAEAERFRIAFQEKGSTQNFQVRLRKKDGQVFTALISAASYFVEDQFAGYQGAIQDISRAAVAEEQRQQLLRQQSTLDELSRDLARILELDNLYQCITQHIRELFEIKTLIISKYDPEHERIEAKYAWHSGKLVDPGRLQNLNLDKIGHGIKSGVILSQQTDYIPDLERYIRETGPLDASALETAKLVGLRNGRKESAVSTLIAPVEVDGQVIGAIQIMNEKLDGFTEVDADLVTKIANVAAIGLQKAYLYEESEKLVERLTTLNRIEQTILENLTLPTTLDMLVDQVVRELEVDAVDILYFHPQLKTLKLIADTGFRQSVLQQIDLEIGEGYAGLAAKTGVTIQVPDLSIEQIVCTRSLAFASEKFVSYYAVPLNAKGKLVGVLEIFNRSPLEPDPQRVELFEMIGGLAAIAIDQHHTQKDLERSRGELRQGLDSILVGWAQSLELRGIESPGHSQRVVELTMRLAEEMDIKRSDYQALEWGTLLHDIGKMGIPDEVLNKGGELSPEEWKMIGRHPIFAQELLGGINVLKSALVIPLYHHERWDGAGYPQGVEGEEIPLLARLYSLVDVWDALLSDRPYRQAWNKREALEHIKAQSGKHFDPRVVDAFLKMIEPELAQEQEPAVERGEAEMEGRGPLREAELAPELSLELEV